MSSYQPLHSHTQHTHPFNSPFSGTTQVSRYQKGKTNLDFTEARDSEWQWHQLGHMQVCTLLQTPHQHPTTQFLQAGCPSCCPKNSVKGLKARVIIKNKEMNIRCPHAPKFLCLAQPRILLPIIRSLPGMQYPLLVFNGLLSRTTWVSWYQKDKTSQSGLK